MASKIFTLAVVIALAFCTPAIHAQVADSLADKPKGNLWGLTFGDYVYKTKADTVGDGLGRGSNQYSKMPANSKFFQFRRVYLGYNYDISSRLSAEVLLAAEDDYYPGSVGNQSSYGDALSNNKFSPYLKLANIRIKNVFPGSDLILGECATPAFPMLSEVVWGYRSVERTVADMRGTPSVDAGAALQGRYGKDGTVGYNFMVGNGTGARMDVDNFQWFYMDVWAKFLNKRLIVDLYQDYDRLTWSIPADSNTDANHHDRRMTKLFVAYTVPKFTVGVEAFSNTLMGDVAAYALVNGLNKTYYRSTKSTAFSIYARGRVYKDKLGFFARYDKFDPGHNIGSITSIPHVFAYSAVTTAYDPTTREQFVTFGLDYTPFTNLHLMPNFYLNTYNCTLPSADYFLNPKAGSTAGKDLAYRLTIYFIFGKKEPVRF